MNKEDIKEAAENPTYANNLRVTRHQNGKSEVIYWAE